MNDLTGPGLNEEVIVGLLGSSTFQALSDEDNESCCICLVRKFLFRFSVISFASKYI